MNKFVDLLEQHVQWLALGLGTLFLAFMVWSYFLSPPATVTVGGDELSPSDVDPNVRRTLAQQLNAKMNRSPSQIEAVPPLFENVQERLTARPQQPELAILTTGGSLNLGGIDVTEDAQQPGAVVAKLPEPLPPAEPMGVATGRAAVNDTLAVGLQNQVATAPTDKHWARVRYTIPLEPLAKAFDEANIQRDLPTQFVKIELVRETRMPDGTWGEQTVVTPVALDPLPRLPVETAPFPVKRDFARQVREGGQGLTLNLLRPRFYEINLGDDPNSPRYVGYEQEWEEAEQAASAAAAAAQALATPQQDRFNPGGRTATGTRTSPGGRGGAPGMSAEERRAEIEMRRIQAEEEAEQRRMEQEFARQQAEEAGGRFAERFGGRGNPQQQQRPLVERPALPDDEPLPIQGQFNPRQMEEDKLLGFAYDDTVEPGTTYRYKVRYYLLNPVFGIFQFVENEALAEKLLLASDVEGATWSEPIEVPSDRQFFVLGVQNNRARIDVIAWKSGRLHSATFEVPAGDPIGAAGNAVGGTVPEDIDFTTQWVVAETFNGAETPAMVLLLDSTGRVERRSDQRNDERYQELKQQVN